MNTALNVLFLPSVLALSMHAIAGTETAFDTPGSMQAFVNWNLDHGACGTWADEGVTEAMWVGIPAGLKVTTTHNTWYDVASDQLFNSHHMETEDGRVISTGSNVMTWDSKRNAVISASSGFDMGKPYHGTSILMGMSDQALTWEYTEMSQGKTTVYDNVITYTGMNTRTNSVKVKGGDGKAWNSEATRANPCMAMLADSGLAGTWEKTLPDGSMIRQVVSWVADEHVLKYERFFKAEGKDWASDSLFVWYWDPAHDHIATLYLDAHGTVINGRVDSITRKNGAVTIVASHEGSRFGGLTMSTEATQVITDKSITTSFKDMSLDGIRHSMSWSETAQSIERTD